MTEIIRSWDGGPLRPNKSMYDLWAYICDRCRQSARSGVRLKGSGWLCASCEMGRVRSDKQPVSRLKFKPRSEAGYTTSTAYPDEGFEAKSSPA